MRRAIVVALALALGLSPPSACARPMPASRYRSSAEAGPSSASAHAGKPTVIHFWGLTCGPCLVEMPKWGKLLAERPDMRLVLVAADPLPQSPERVNGALQRAGLEQPKAGPSPTASTNGCATRSIRPGPASCRARC